MRYTLSDAVELLEELEKKTKNPHLASAKSVLSDLKPLLGENKDMESLSKLFEKGAQYATQATSDETVAADADFNLWAENVAKEILEYKGECCKKIQDIHNTYESAQSFLGKSLSNRKKTAIGFFIAFMVLSVITAVVAIYGLFYHKEQWGESLASVLGIIDFSVGICGVFIERINDMREQKISRAMEEIMRTPTTQPDKAEEYAKNIKAVIKKSVVGNGNEIYHIDNNAQINIIENSIETNNETQRNVRQWEEEMKWWLER